jgi:type IV secretory pathway VirJ component
VTDPDATMNLSRAVPDVTHSEFSKVADLILTSRLSARPCRVVLRCSPLELGTNDTAAALARDGALVVGVDLPTYLQRLDTHTGEICHDVVGDIESISRQIQRERGNTSYLTPIVAGIGEGGALAAIMLAQAPAATVAGAVS